MYCNELGCLVLNCCVSVTSMRRGCNYALLVNSKREETARRSFVRKKVPTHSRKKRTMSFGPEKPSGARRAMITVDKSVTCFPLRAARG